VLILPSFRRLLTALREVVGVYNLSQLDMIIKCLGIHSPLMPKDKKYRHEEEKLVREVEKAFVARYHSEYPPPPLTIYGEMVLEMMNGKGKSS